MHLCGKMDKIRYRLVYNRQNTLNRQGTALVQVEAYLNQKENLLEDKRDLKPECWSREGAQVINHPQSNELNTMLYEYILYLQGIELGVLEARNTCHTLTTEGCCQEEKYGECQLLHFCQISH